VRNGVLRAIFRLVCLVGLLPACSLAPVINHQVFDYYGVDDLAANQIILLNILYARDGAPLHFSELSQIRGQLTAQFNGSTTFPFGPIAHANVDPRHLATLGITVASQPSFDISSLDTKDFTDGVMTPISPSTFAFFVNEGIDYHLVLLLLVSGIQQAGGEMVFNAPLGARAVCAVHTIYSSTPLTKYAIVGPGEVCADGSAPSLSEFEGFLLTANRINRQIYPVTLPVPPRPVGPPFTLNMGTQLRGVTDIDPNKYMLRPAGGGRYQLMAPSHQSMVVLCEDPNTPASRDPNILQDHGILSALSTAAIGAVRVPADACSLNRAADEDADAGTLANRDMVVIGTTPGTFILRLRSTLEVIQYVGRVLAWQQLETETLQRQNPAYPERCLTLTSPYLANRYDPTVDTCRKDVLFRLIKTNSLTAATDLNITFDGHRWSVPPPMPCPDPKQCDYSLETMSIISLLLNQNKATKDIGTTPAVQVVP
jgi:hypothetical protein